MVWGNSAIVLVLRLKDTSAGVRQLCRNMTVAVLEHLRATPLKGPDYPAWHADTPPLFPESGTNDTPLVPAGRELRAVRRER